MAPAEVVQSGGTYRIVNASSGTLLDLSQQDNRSVIGWPRNDAPNQHWTVVWAGNGWTFQSVSSNTFLGIEATPENGVPLIVKQEPTIWHIWHDQINSENYRVYIPNTTQNWDLYDYGNKRPGDPVTLWTNWNGVHQTWKFERV
ncbi:carbohydrate-binding module family 13 protein [Moniliophthora roreri MCA 2997]|uniref:Carbohydrate-binding module family 13 protein n=1 Tax=Moniliophthora roreri (strain MCA 2997) TaxID=1381753 RepID=V2WR60_MONRO|nr:carbohydrate-binding module family 13 protein [Moniliophthora roreri MCA 2997]KAI3614999.1 carbohydrate-binding module family 13 protein [Moniliophthora roreri]